MKFGELIARDTIVLGLRSTGKWEAIDELIDRLVAAGRLDPALRDAARRAVVERENSLSTGIEQGVALPHGPVEGLECVLGALGIAGAPGIPWESIDGRPSDLIVLLCIPARHAKGSIRTLAGVARLLRHERLRARIRQAEDCDAVMRVVHEEEALDP